MAGEYKDVGVIIDGTDPISDTVQAGVALRLSHHHGACLTVFEQADIEGFERPTLLGDTDETPYAGVEICGLRDAPLRVGRHGLRSSMETLLHETRSSGRWINRVSAADLLEHIRSMDLVVVGSPITVDPGITTHTGDVVARAGRPILVLPRKFARRRPNERQLGHRILIAWNASAESARAVHDALPFLRSAEEVTVLFVNEHRDRIGAQRLVASLAAHLCRHGVKVRPEVMHVADAWPARIILDRLSELDANLLVMGAFSRSRLKEAWFGGVSDELLHAVAIPVLTSH
jgi:nucleotide-binding universal stress UspA family protein